jgi:tetratricopeptide (TPR) repeat protein
VSTRRWWRDRLLPVLAFPGLILLGFLVEQIVLVPRVSSRPPEESVGFWRTQAARHPDFAPVQVRLGLAQRQAGNLTGAREAFERALAADPHAEDAAIGLNGTFRDSGDVPGAVAQMASFLRDNPRCLVCRQNLAADYLTLGRVGDARREIDIVLASGTPPVSPIYGPADLRGTALVLAGRIYAAAGERERAIELLEQGLARQPGDPQARAELEQQRRARSSARAPAPP